MLLIVNIISMEEGQHLILHHMQSDLSSSKGIQWHLLMHRNTHLWEEEEEEEEEEDRKEEAGEGEVVKAVVEEGEEEGGTEERKEIVAIVYMPAKQHQVPRSHQ